MRILDIGLATGYALICLSLVAVMSPYGAGAEAAGSAASARAGSAAYHYVQTVGLVFLSGASAAQVCLSLQQYSNSTVILGGGVSGQNCGGSPTAAIGASSLTFELADREVVIEAWVVGP